jgi:hypothetical protein
MMRRHILLVVTILLCLVNVGGWIWWPHVNISSVQQQLRARLYDLDRHSNAHGLTYWITHHVAQEGDLLPHVTRVHVTMLAADVDTLYQLTPASHWTSTPGLLLTRSSTVTTVPTERICVGYHHGERVFVNILQDPSPSPDSLQPLHILYPLATMFPFVLSVLWIYLLNQ